MFGPDVLDLDAGAEIERIIAWIRSDVMGKLRKRGAALGVSGGVDSAVVAALCARAVGPSKVLALLMPEKDSSPDSTTLGRSLAEALGVAHVLEDIAPALEGARCYERQIEAIRTAVPDYGAGWKCKLVLPSVSAGPRINLTRLTVQDPHGKSTTVRLAPAAYQQLVAATNFKQRLRKTMEYYHADRLNYAVAGTPNRLEYDQGFFVKNGDGAADFKPIAHLYKTQVYHLAKHLGIPEEIRSRAPTTDTFSMPQTQEEFYFALPYGQMDLCLYARNHAVPASEVARMTGLEPSQVEYVFKDIDAKRRAARYLHAAPMLIEPVTEV
jgi:NAD+ synthase